MQTRHQKRMNRLEKAGLKYLRVVMHPDDAEKIRGYAEQLYKARGVEYPCDDESPATKTKD